MTDWNTAGATAFVVVTGDAVVIFLLFEYFRWRLIRAFKPPAKPRTVWDWLREKTRR